MNRKRGLANILRMPSAECYSRQTSISIFEAAVHDTPQYVCADRGHAGGHGRRRHKGTLITYQVCPDCTAHLCSFCAQHGMAAVWLDSCTSTELA